MTAEFSPVQVKHLFYERERERCFRCLRLLVWHERGFGWSVHHRKPRGMGGTKRQVTHADGVVLCGSGTTGCHGWVEKNRERALELGYLIPLNATTDEFRPERVRLRRLTGGWWLLTESGRAVEVESPR